MTRRPLIRYLPSDSPAMGVRDKDVQEIESVNASHSMIKGFKIKRSNLLDGSDPASTQMTATPLNFPTTVEDRITSSRRVKEILHPPRQPLSLHSKVTRPTLLSNLHPDSITKAIGIVEAEMGDEQFWAQRSFHSKQPLVIVQSNSGRPFLVRPSAGFQLLPEKKWRQFIDAIRHQAVTPTVAPGQILRAASIAVANALTEIGSPLSARQAEDWFHGWARYKLDRRTCFAMMLRSLAVTLGDRPLDIPFALGEFWRHCNGSPAENAESYFHTTDGKHKPGGNGYVGNEHGEHWIRNRLRSLAFGPTPGQASRFLRLVKAKMIEIRTPAQ